MVLSISIRTDKLIVLAMNYRKCLSADTAFPAPLLDALAGYIYLTQTLGFSAENITLIGESAGAHLCLILSQHLADLSLPQPGCMVLIAPWSDFTMNPSDPRGTYISNSKYDFLLPGRLHMGAMSATRHYTPEAIRSAYFSPALATAGQWKYLKKEGVRVMVAYGTSEVFKDECEAVTRGMFADGCDVTVHIVSLSHVWVIGDLS
jgi:acetyl esterase/lipase